MKAYLSFSKVSGSQWMTSWAWWNEAKDLKQITFVNKPRKTFPRPFRGFWDTKDVSGL